MARTPSTYILRPIGWVRSALVSRADAPRQGDEGAPDARLQMEPAFLPGLKGIRAGQDILILTWLHEARRDQLAVHPRDDETQPLAGVFATRSADRPNPIGLHRARVLAIEEGGTLHVQGLEAIDGTPVIDLKPVLGREAQAWLRSYTWSGFTSASQRLDPEVAVLGLRLDLLPEPLALVRLSAGSPVPGWAAEARHLLSITRTPTELSIVADAAAVPSDVPAERAYRAFRVQGPLPLHWVGVMAAVAGPLAEAAVSIFPIATYDTDYVLVKEADVPRARNVLIRAGHEVVG